MRNGAPANRDGRGRGAGPVASRAPGAGRVEEGDVFGPRAHRC